MKTAKFSVAETVVVILITANTVALVAPLAEQRIAEARSRLLAETVQDIQLAIERYAMDTDGVYPASVQQLITAGYIQSWPKNPIAKGYLNPQEPGEPWRPGGFIYIPSESIVPSGHEACATGPRPMENYLLVVYSARPHGNFARAIRQHQLGQPDSGHIDWRMLDDVCRRSAGLRSQIDWRHVDLLLSSGADYFVGCKRAAY
jgi:hypothetical protein